jgi:hypothetical protein
MWKLVSHINIGTWVVVLRQQDADKGIWAQGSVSNRTVDKYYDGESRNLHTSPILLG